MLAKNEDELHGPVGLTKVLLWPPSAGRSDHPQRKGGPPHCLQFPALVLNLNRSSFVKAVRFEPLVDCSLLFARVWNQARQCLHDRVLNCLQYRVLCSSMDVQCGDYHLCGLYLHSLSLSVKRGYVGPSMVSGSWDGAGGIFVFLNTFVFFSLARFGFSKKSDEKQRSNKVHPNKVFAY